MDLQVRIYDVVILSIHQ